jgi:hypothetical protein
MGSLVIPWLADPATLLSGKKKVNDIKELDDVKDMDRHQL